MEAIMGTKSEKTRKNKAKVLTAGPSKASVGARFQLLQVWVLEGPGGASGTGEANVVSSPTKRVAI